MYSHCHTCTHTWQHFTVSLWRYRVGSGFLWAACAIVDCAFMSDVLLPEAEEYCSVVLQHFLDVWALRRHSCALSKLHAGHIASLSVVVSFPWQRCKDAKVELWGQRARTCDVLIMLHYLWRRRWVLLLVWFGFILFSDTFSLSICRVVSWTFISFFLT